jgi:hypothetical protein
MLGLDIGIPVKKTVGCNLDGNQQMPCNSLQIQ